MPNPVKIGEFTIEPNASGGITVTSHRILPVACINAKGGTVALTRQGAGYYELADLIAALTAARDMAVELRGGGKSDG